MTAMSSQVNKSQLFVPLSIMGGRGGRWVDGRYVCGRWRGGVVVW